MPDWDDTDYSALAADYAEVRRPDPRIGKQLADALGDARTVVNVGAGTGSYEPTDRTVVAVEPSAEMRAQRDPALPPAIDATRREAALRRRELRRRPGRLHRAPLARSRGGPGRDAARDERPGGDPDRRP
jgi:hypothetical protein